MWKSCPSVPPECFRKLQGDRPKVVVLVGLQGSGHSYWTSIFERLGLHTAQSRTLRSISTFWKDDICQQLFPEYLKSNQSSTSWVVHGSSSWPNGVSQTDPTKHPALVELICLNQSKTIDLRLMYLQRSLLESVTSTPNDISNKVEAIVGASVMSLTNIYMILSQAAVRFVVGNMRKSLLDKVEMLDKLLSGYDMGPARRNVLIKAIEAVKLPPQNPLLSGNSTALSYLSSQLWIHSGLWADWITGATKWDLIIWRRRHLKQATCPNTMPTSFPGKRLKVIMFVGIEGSGHHYW